MEANGSGNQRMSRDLDGAAFGEQLRRERERRGVAVEAICASTKLPVRHIRALETGALRDLPGGVFRRGFFRSYIRAVGLEEAYWMPRFEESCRLSGLREPGDSSWAVFAENVKNSRYVPRRRSRPYGRWLVLFLLLALLAAGSAWTFHASRNRSRQPGFVKSLKGWVHKLPSP